MKDQKKDQKELSTVDAIVASIGLMIGHNGDDFRTIRDTSSALFIEAVGQMLSEVHQHCPPQNRWALPTSILLGPLFSTKQEDGSMEFSMVVSHVAADLPGSDGWNQLTAKFTAETLRNMAEVIEAQSLRVTGMSRH